MYDLALFKSISDEVTFFVTRIKGNAQIEVLGQHQGFTLKSIKGKRPYVRKKIRIIIDERIRLTIPKTAELYPKENSAGHR